MTRHLFEIHWMNLCWRYWFNSSTCDSSEMHASFFLVTSLSLLYIWLVPVPISAFDHQNEHSFVISGSKLVDEAAPLTDEVKCTFSIETSSERCRCTSIGDVYCNADAGNKNGMFTSIPRFRVAAADGSFPTYRSLHLDRQAVTHLPRAAFGNVSFARIVLNFNPLGDRINVRAFEGLETVTTDLELGSCGLTALPSGLLDDMEQLKRLHLWSNSIRRIPGGFFRGAGALEELLLWSNEIDELDNLTLAGLWTLRRLDLDRNVIVDLRRDAFRHLLELEVLRIGENRIAMLHGATFSHMAALRAMSLDRNRIRYVHERAFEGLPRLLTLDLTGNEISLLPDDLFAGLGSLVELRLAKNQLEYVWARTFAGLRSLRRLDLSNNKIADLPDGAFRHSPGLEQLIVDENRLSTLRRCAVGGRLMSAEAETNAGRVSGVRSTSFPLRMLSLVGNPMHCDCRLAWIVQQFPGVTRPVADWGGGRTLRLRGSCRVGSRNSANHHVGQGQDGSQITYLVGNRTQTFINGRYLHRSSQQYSFIGQLTSACSSTLSNVTSQDCR